MDETTVRFDPLLRAWLVGERPSGVGGLASLQLQGAVTVRADLLTGRLAELEVPLDLAQQRPHKLALRVAAQLCVDRVAEIMNAPAPDAGTVRNAPLDGDDAREAACRLAVLNALRGDEGDDPSLWAAEAAWLEARLGLPEDHVLEQARLGAAALDALTDTQLAMLGKVNAGRLAAIIATVRDHAGPADGGGRSCRGGIWLRPARGFPS